MVELVDSVDLGSTAKSVQVRVLLPAPRQAAIFARKSPPALFSSLFPFHYSLFSPRTVPRRCVVGAAACPAPTFMFDTAYRPSSGPFGTTFPQGKAISLSRRAFASIYTAQIASAGASGHAPPVPRHSCIPPRRAFRLFPFHFSLFSFLL